jgi:anti-sigma-K factor RskA
MPEPEATLDAERSDRAATAYRELLLGQLSEAERQRLEKQALVDDELFLAVLAAEDDLIDAAASGELDPVDIERLACIPGLDQRLDFARALKKTADERTASSIRVVRPGWQQWRRWLAAAAALVLAAGLLLLMKPAGISDLSSAADSYVLPMAGLRGSGAELSVICAVMCV